MRTGELRDLLHAKADSVAPHSVTIATRLDGALRRARTLRRRRYAAAGIVAASFIAGVTALTVPEISGHFLPEPADRQSVLPEFANGKKLLGTATIELPDRHASVTVVPEAFPLAFVDQCQFTASADTYLWVEFEVASWTGPVGSSCHSGPAVDSVSPATPGDQDAWARLGVHLGEPMTVHVTVARAESHGENGATEVALPESGTATVGIYQQVPWEEYEFPTRPDTIVALPVNPAVPEALARTSAESGRPNAPREFAVDLTQDDLSLSTVATTPGLIHIFLNGTHVTTHGFWDYSPMEQSVRLAESYETATGQPLPPGEPVHIRLLAEHFTADWQAYAMPCQVWEGGHGCASADVFAND